MSQPFPGWLADRSACLLTLLVSVTVLPLVAGLSAAERQGRGVKRLLKTVRQDEDPAAWAEAVRLLREEGGEAKELLDRELRRLLRKYSAARKTLEKRIDALGGPPEPSDRAEAARTAWEEAEQAAREFIFDEEKFPPAFNTMVISEGWEIAFRLGAAAERAFESAEASLSSFGERIRTTDRDAARRLREDHARVDEACGRVARELGGEPPESAVREVSWVVLQIIEGDFSKVERRLRKLPRGRDRFVLFYAYSSAILGANEACHDLISRATARSTVELNRYRMALGRAPLALNPKLMRAARGHSEEMARLKYFGHDSPTEGRRTEGDRATLEDYGGSVSENIYAAASMSRAIPVWKKSGKHHRTMTLAENVDAGISAVGPVTLVLGSGEAGSPPALDY